MVSDVRASKQREREVVFSAQKIPGYVSICFPTPFDACVVSIPLPVKQKHETSHLQDCTVRANSASGLVGPVRLWSSGPVTSERGVNRASGIHI